MTKKGLLERLAEGPVIGDGGFIFSLEKRGYVKAGPWTPEGVMEHPEAVRQLHRYKREKASTPIDRMRIVCAQTISS